MSRMRGLAALVSMAALLMGGAVRANDSPVSVEIVSPDGRVFQEYPVRASDGALRSYLQAEKGARYQVRVRNHTGERLGLVIAVDGRNIINGKKSDLERREPMYVLDAWGTQDYAGWRANLEAINEFYFSDWSDSYAEAFGDRSARGVIALAVFREVPLPALSRSYEGDAESAPSADAAAGGAAPSAARPAERSAGTGYGDRRTDHAVRVEFLAHDSAESRHFIKYEWRDTLCRKRVIDCDRGNRFWDESALGFAPPPPRR